jgi:hypothetical protein
MSLYLITYIGTWPTSVCIVRKGLLGIWVFALVASAVIGFAIGAYFQRPDGSSGGALWGMIAALGIFISARPSLSSAMR